MGTLTIERTIVVPSRQVRDVVTDWAGCPRWMLLITMRLDQGLTCVGWSFAGLTDVGRLRFADVMGITEWAPLSENGQGHFDWSRSDICWSGGRR